MPVTTMLAVGAPAADLVAAARRALARWGLDAEQIVGAALLAILSIFFDIRPLLAGAGLVGLAVTIGGQTVVRDFITGFFLLIEQQFAVGDRVRIGGIEGVVHRITLRMVVLRDDRGALHYIANGSISAVSNLSHVRACVS
ncbi:MAG: mechanosensitive ion channel [Gemmatimonadetes bacterium]|nr:mechanosensitive ion channel [Gemmatimonadota bacterium]